VTARNGALALGYRRHSPSRLDQPWLTPETLRIAHLAHFI
jgi:hypothetical protein